MQKRGLTKYAIVIGASDETIYAIRQAQKYGMTVLAFDGNEKAEGLKYADQAYVVDIRDPKKIFAVIDKMDISAKDMVVLPVPIGRYLISSGAFNEHYGLIGAGNNTTEVCTDKWIFHKTLKQLGLRKINCNLIKAGKTTYVPESLPVIVKPRYGAGSRQVLRISSQEEWDGFAKEMPYDEDFIVEDAVDGQEYGVDGMVINKRFHLILARKKLITTPPYRQCVGYISTNHKKHAELLERIKEFMSELIAAIQLEDGIVHADLMKEEQGLFIIELSARPSGHRLHDIFVPMVTGIDMISEFIRYTKGGHPSIHVKETDNVYIIRYFDIESKINIIPPKEYIMNKYSLLEYECNLIPGEIRKIKDGHSLMGRGYFILEGKNEKEVCELANSVLNEYL
ncbi:MAG: ATP-grasp domain-containing protein [Lachnospiraceae bacterium]|nr:ATP-grasp domain-containing protein [Lachnospiraceae bacterium]